MISDRDAAILGALTDVLDFRSVMLEVVCDVFAWVSSLEYSARIVFGVRSPLEQRRLFARGRKLIVAAHPERYTSWRADPESGPIVTRSLPRDSAHCYGAAIDLALIDRASHTWIADDHPAWTKLAEIAEARGLASGHRWPHFRDSAHIELRDWRAYVLRGELRLIGEGGSHHG